MYDYEIYKTRQADLLRRADQERLARQVRRDARRAARHSGGNGTEGQVSSVRNRFARAA
ncbi:hypothetical protein [Streptomyces sp. NBC_00083]|uniref:hypothetical protein n=1 Tax=Streptomyces sp. NBC_00083 TaxID=2975647 RepID=UPI00224F81BA|nr:hypothetical protein [Streptomyces sp. NBC_00083]MCX5385846.1 hypothetical protein [Streptomyces sp. NBC_00083]